MSFGIVEVITLLMGLSGFSVGTNPKSPTAEQALEYAVADADVIAHFDAASVIPGNYKVLTGLATQPAIKASPELAKMVRKAVAELDGPRGLVKGATGIDITTDVSDATAFLKFVPKQDPNVVLAVHGKFSPGTIAKVAKLVGKAAVKAGAGAWVDTGDGNAVALTKNGVLLAGTTSLVKDRMADSWKAPALTAGTNLGNDAELITGKPILAIAMHLGPAARTEALSAIGGTNMGTDMIKRHKFAAFAIYKDGAGWSWIDSTKVGLESMTTISEGMIEIMRASQIAPRGFAKVVMGSLESYRGTNKHIDDLIKRKTDVWKIVEAYTGDGQFKASVTPDAKTLKLSVRLVGKTLSEVLPLGGMLPLIGAALISPRSTSEPTQMSPPMMPASPPATPVPGPPAKKANPPKRP